MALSSPELARYSRHLSLSEFGVAGQEKLKAARVVVIGAGGLGSPALLYLAAAGVGTIGIVDFDRVDISNLQRQVLFTIADVGESKAQVAATRLRALNPQLQFNVHELELNAGNVLDIFRNYDVVLDGTDRFATRYLVNDACVILHKPLVSAAIHRFEGQAFTYMPAHAPCYRCLFPEAPAAELVPNCAEAGVLGVLPGVMGAIQATEAIKLLTGMGALLTGRLLAYDALTMSFNEFKFARRRDCAVCGEQPTIHSPQDSVVQCNVPTRIPIDNISATQLRELLQATTTLSYQLVDVREPYEFATGHLANSINLPLATLAADLAALDQSKHVVFICRSGVRSQQACVLARQQGITSTVSLAGGLQQWNDNVATAQRCVL